MRKTALVFPGQGSQYVGMGKKFYERYPMAKDIFEEANDLLGFDIKKLCFEGDINELTKTEITQPAILTVSTAMFKVFMEETGTEPFIFAGHSLGELSALTCAGGIDFADAVKLVRQRGLFMQEAAAIGVGAMAAVSGLNEDVISQECINSSGDESIVVISNYNSPEQTVVSGHKEAVVKVGEKLKEMGGKVIPLKVSAPFHSPLMQLASEKFEKELQKYTFNDLKHTVISNVNALPYEGKDSIVSNLSEQLIKPVRWKETMEYMKIQEVDCIVEIGPQTVLRNLTKKNAISATAYSYDQEEDYQVFKKDLLVKENGKIPDKNISVFITRCLATAVCTKNNNWDNDEYQKGVIEPYRKIKKMHEEIERQGTEPTNEQMLEALEMLRSVFATKKTSIEEQSERFEQIFSETGTKSLFEEFMASAG